MPLTIEHEAPERVIPAAVSADASPPARQWLAVLAPYRAPLLGRALFELAITLVPFIGLWLLMLFSLPHGYWLTLLLAVPTAGFLVRLFMIQHDCGHGSFFQRRWANDCARPGDRRPDADPLRLLAA